MAIPAGTAATSEQTSKVVGIIEAVVRSTTPVAAAADVRSAMRLLQSLPATNVELWAKLARAAAGAGCWPLALECAESAAKVRAPAVRCVHTCSRAVHLIPACFASNNLRGVR